jgi:hypothetical protein
MAIRISDGLRKALVGPLGVRAALANGRLKVFTGSQPANANAATSGTLLVTYTLSGGAYTAETRAIGSVKITAGTAGASNKITKVTVGGIPICGEVLWVTSHAATATALAAAINNYLSQPDCVAVVDGVDNTKVNIYAPFTTGADWNTVVVDAVVEGDVTTTDVNFADGVTAVNGLNWQYPDSTPGVLVKEAGNWLGVAVADGNAGYFRFEADGTDPGTTDSSAVYRRMDGSIGTSGADLNLTSVTIANGSTQTISSWTITLPAS